MIAVLKYTAREDLVALFTMWIFTGKVATEFQDIDSHDLNLPNIEGIISPEFAEKKTQLYHLPVYEAMEEIIRIFNLSPKNPVFLQGLLEVVFNYSEKFNTDIHSFLKWWEQYSESEKTTLPVAEYKNAVRISTSHKAKGLEFPIVFVPFSWKIFDTSSGFKQQVIWVKSDQVGKKIKDFPFLIDVQKEMENSLFREDYVEEKKLSILDSINLLYVAFTRAQDRLYIYYGTGKNANIKNTSDLIEQAIRDMEWEQRSDAWIKGVPDEKIKCKDKIHPEILQSFPSHSWRHKITVRRRSSDLWKMVDTERIRKVEKGVLMHTILSEIKTIDDIDQAVEDKYRQGYLSGQEMRQIQEDMHALMKIEYSRGRVEDWFHPHLRIMNEKSIITEDREFRPDRVIIGPEKVIMVEYKTGKREKEHKLQLEEYGALLEEMGYKNLEKYILYLQTGSIEEF
ncbi:MAG: 3'-5' exonuclease [bacterium]